MSTRTQAATKLRKELDQALADIREVCDALEAAYTPEASRETMAEAIGEALETLEGYKEEDGGDDEDEDDE